MESNNIYGIVVNGILYSNRMELKLRRERPNGIYSIDMLSDDFQESIFPANIEDARKFFQKASKVQVIRGISFHDGIIPENPVSFEKIPIKVIDATYDEFEEIEVAIVRGKVCYYIQTISTDKAYVLMDLQQIIESNTSTDISGTKGVTPEIRIAFTFHMIEAMERKRKELEEKKRKEMEEPTNAIKAMMEESGAKVEFVKVLNTGYEVQWESSGYRINTKLDKKFRVMEAGFCTSRNDKTQSARSVAHLLKDYAERRVSRGDYVNITRVVR